MLALVGALALASATSPSDGERPETVELSWRAPDGCPDEAAMLERITAAILDPAGDGTLVVDGRVEASSDGYHLTLRTTYGEAVDERVVVDGDCDALGDTALLFVAFSVDPAAGEPRDESQETPTVEPSAPPAAEPRRVPAATVDTAESRPPPSLALTPERRRPGVRRPRAVVLGLAPQFEFGALPGVSGGARLSVGLDWERAEFAAYGFYEAPRRTGTVAGASGLVQMGAAGGRGCVVLGTPVRVPICGLAEVGGLRVVSRGPIPANRLRFIWAAAGARVGVERRWGRVGVFGAAEGAIPIARSEVLLGEALAFETWPVTLRAVAGVKIFFATDSA